MNNPEDLRTYLFDGKGNKTHRLKPEFQPIYDLIGLFPFSDEDIKKGNDFLFETYFDKVTEGENE